MLDLWIIREILVRKFSSLVLVLDIIIKVIINIFFTFSVHVSFFLMICPKALRVLIVPGRIRQVWFLPLVSGCQIIFSWIELMTVTPFLKIVVYSLGFWLILVILSCWFIVRVILAVLIVTIPVIFRARTFWKPLITATRMTMILKSCILPTSTNPIPIFFFTVSLIRKDNFPITLIQLIRILTI